MSFLKPKTSDGKQLTDPETDEDMRRMLQEEQIWNPNMDEETRKATKRAISEERKWKLVDGRRVRVTDEPTTSTTHGLETVLIDERTTVTDEQVTTMTTTAVEEVVVEADPLALGVDVAACPPSTSAATVDVAACPPSASAATDGDAKVNQGLKVDQGPKVDPSLATPIPLRYGEWEMDHEKEREKRKEVKDDGDVDIVEKGTGGIARRVAGRRRAVIVDDESETTMSVASVTSADEDTSMATSPTRGKKGKGAKRRREPVKEEGKGSGEERKKKKGKRKEERIKDTPEKEDMVGKDGEPKGVVAHVFEDMSSSVLGGNIQEWADMVENIRAKSKNIQGKLSGDLKKCVANIKEGVALLVARAEASGDPQFLRIRNTELTAQLKEADREIARLKEHRKRSPRMTSPSLSRRVMKAVAAEVEQSDTAVEAVVSVPAVREEFPPLPQRPPRDKVQKKDGDRKKAGPRIVSNIQVLPPYKERRKEMTASSAVSGSEVEWRVAAGSRRKGRIKGDRPSLPPPPPPPVPVQRRQQPRAGLPKPPKTVAVIITGRTEGFSYSDAMKSCRQHISLGALGIEANRMRRARNGGLVIEVAGGEESRAKAEELATRLRSVLKETAAVACPTMKRELIVAGFEESVSAEEIAEELCSVGGCSRSDIKVGPVRILNSGMGTIWAQLPVAAAAKVAEVGRINAGWCKARVELLKVRPLQCYKCWAYGHMQAKCRSVVDRRGACFRCGQKGHVAGTCSNPLHCMVCHDAGLEASHRLGGPQCAAQERQGAK